MTVAVAVVIVIMIVSLSTNLAVTSSGIKRKHTTVDDKNIYNYPFILQLLLTSTATTMTPSRTNLYRKLTVWRTANL